MGPGMGRAFSLHLRYFSNCMSILQAIILAIVEGLTEFLPVSSTGHMIIASWLMGIQSDEFVKTYEVAIQLGAILAVIVLYFRQFFNTLEFYFKLFVAFLPTAILGVLLDDYIDQLLGDVTIVATSLLVGGIVLIFIDKLFPPSPNEGSTMVTYKRGIFIGLWQSLAMIPGVSRSAASIIGGQAQGLSRKAAAEFSFFLAVPTMFGATGLKLFKLYKTSPQVLTDNVGTLLLGNLVAFGVGIVAISFFIKFLTRYGFRIFGIYRVIVGLVLLLAVYVFKVPLTLE